MELSNSSIKEFLIFSQKKAFLLIREMETKTPKKFLIFQETETLRKLLIFQEVTFWAGKVKRTKEVLYLK